MDKRGIVSIHAGMFFIFGVILGAVLMYFAITKGYLPVTLPGA